MEEYKQLKFDFMNESKRDIPNKLELNADLIFAAGTLLASIAIYAGAYACVNQ